MTNPIESIEKMSVTQFFKSCGILFNLKHYSKISMVRSVYFAIFHFYLNYSILNWGKANNNTTLLPLIQ